MQATVYANLTTRRLTTTLGGSAVSFPAFVQGDKVRIGLRFAESLEGSPIEVQRIVTHIRASIGFVDVRPTTGFFVLRVDGQDTAPIPHDATAGTVQTALLWDTGPRSVTFRHQKWRICSAAGTPETTTCKTSNFSHPHFKSLARQHDRVIEAFMNESAKICTSGSGFTLITDRSVNTPQTRPVAQ